MAENTSIEWADHTFNPWTGCTKVGPGCDHCYAEGWAKRSGAVKWGSGQARRRTSPTNWALPTRWNAHGLCECADCGWRGKWSASFCDSSDGGNHICPRCSSMLVKPVRPRVFCASLADVFDNEVVDAWRVDLFRLIAATPNLDWLLLTKRIGNASKMIHTAVHSLIREADCGQDEPPYWPWPNVWLGATVVNQEEADRDIPKLLATPARVRFLSIEPMLGPVDLSRWLRIGRCQSRGGGTPGAPLRCGLLAGHDDEHSALIETSAPWFGVVGDLHWVIAGGESGHGARPMHPDWARSLRDQCEAAGVSFLFKQWGEFASSEAAGLDLGDCYERSTTGGWVEPDGAFSMGKGAAPCHRSAAHVFRVGKKAAGRLLDGRTHDGYPEVSHAAA